MRATLDMAKKLKPDVAQFFPVMVYPGTVMYDEYQKQGYIVSDNFRGWINEEGLHNCVIDLPEVSAKEMVIFCDACRKEFYLRPGYMFYKGIQSLLSPSEGVRTFKAARKFFKPLFLGTKLD
jgi:anaerobic magnesium-protoporphyrin IX monomethyl ester cyclase